MRHKILEAALGVADERGLESVSMRAVAQRVGVSAMALYPHVSNKEALLDGMVDVLLAELLSLREPVPAEAGWWTRLRTVAYAARELSARHPSAFSLLIARPSVTPDAIRATDLVYQALLDAGVPDDQVARVERLFTTFVIGFTASNVNGRFSKGTLNPRARRAQLAPEDVPAHYRLAEHLDRTVDWDAEFEADLDDLRTLVESLTTGGRRSALIGR
ncbi:TetR/AcrR family transcriptional regulator C-terminal domain-containing protein [Amycolatopsis endophytica]|uniref:AcrR family transcriptional regulator n=1 Tax=Amycolatopsis endophytica TaxID=860233 RepID=A0A853AXY7_9PSEU|nr:TetR family transcriptional regulator [Amycolatopsis endophytica]NYI87578.1 AcrR family transcriptional regulator [Amycolatopsis endophytica]